MTPPHNTETTLDTVKSIIAVSSCKGGVGKSTVAAYIAQGLAGRGFKAGLLDADIYGPSIPALFDLTRVNVTINEQKEFVPIEHGGLKIMSFGFLLGDAPAVMRGPMVTRYIQQILQRTAWGDLDYLLIDMPPGTGDVQLTITQSVRLNGAVIVTTPQTLSLIDVARGILMFEKVSVPILGVIENMAYFLCPDCGCRHALFGSHAARSLQERFGVEVLAQWPMRQDFIRPVNPETTATALVRETVDRVLEALDKTGSRQKEIPAVTFDAQQVTLRWPSGQEVRVANRDLRLSCQCALCVDERSGKKILKEKDVRPDIAPKIITPLGNYAVGIAWNDGHSSGIYPYKNILEEAKKQEARSKK